MQLLLSTTAAAAEQFLLGVHDTNVRRRRAFSDFYFGLSWYSDLTMVDDDEVREY